MSLQVNLRVKRVVKNLDISEVAKRSGVPASALQFYEEKGLIASIGRRGLRRLFVPVVLTGQSSTSARAGELPERVV